MADSIVLNVLIPADLTDDEYDQCGFPVGNRSSVPAVSADFKPSEARSPLTNAGLIITPLGMTILGKRGERFKYGRIAGYQVSANIPACTAGHNRQLVNGVWQAGRIAIVLLKCWLAENGCSAKGLACFESKNSFISSVTLTYLFACATQQQARDVLHEFRTHSEAVLNASKTEKGGLPAAFSYPPRPDPGKDLYTYTSYIRMREHKIAAYVKERGQPGAFLLPVANECLEASLQASSEATLRVEVKLHGKWLVAHELSRLQDWRENSHAYELAFGLVREDLRLDKNIRSKRLKRSTVASLPLNSREKSYLLLYLEGVCVREEHSDARSMEHRAWCKAYSAARRRIFEVTGLDLNIPYACHTRGLVPTLSAKLKYPGEYSPRTEWAEHVFSRASAPRYVAALNWYIRLKLSGRDDCPLPPLRDVDKADTEDDC